MDLKGGVLNIDDLRGMGIYGWVYIFEVIFFDSIEFVFVVDLF